MLRGRKSRRTLQIELGGQRIRIERLSPQGGVELCLLVGPYVTKLRRALRIIKKDLDPAEASQRLHYIAETMKEAPGDFLEFVGLLVGRRAEWVAKNTTALELVAVLPVVSEYQGLWKVLALGNALGLLELGE